LHPENAGLGNFLYYNKNQFFKGAIMAGNTQSFVDSETQKIYAEYKRQAEAGGSKMAYKNHSEESTAEAFCKASESLVKDFAKATGNIV